MCFCAYLSPSHKTEYFLTHFREAYLSDIPQGSVLATMGHASAQVDVDGIVFILYFCEESVVAEHVHRDMVVEKDPVWLKVFRVVIHVVRYVLKARAWRGLGVVIVFVIGLIVVFFFSVDIVCFMVDVHI